LAFLAFVFFALGAGFFPFTFAIVSPVGPCLKNGWRSIATGPAAV